jgi:dinuclear metal center YbgI/SA1388 family protein
MLLKELVNEFEKIAPGSLQESYDNSGIQIGNPLNEVRKGLICLDITEAIIDEAKKKDCDLVISHHPLIFSGLKSITGKNYTERIAIQAIKNDISIVSFHTNLDSVKQGVNKIFAEKIGLVKLQILQPRAGLLKKLVVFCPNDQVSKVREAIFKAGAGQIGDYDCCSFNLEGTGTFRGGSLTNPFVGERGVLHTEPEIRIETILPDYLLSNVLKAMLEAHPYEEVAYDIYPLDNVYNQVGMGMIGEFENPVSENEFLQLLKNKLDVPYVRHSEFTGKKISRMALCGGSGSFLKGKALEAGADAFITADIKYHDFFEMESRLLLVDVGHYESEQFTKELLYEILSKKITNFALLISDQNTNPVRYF